MHEKYPLLLQVYHRFTTSCQIWDTPCVLPFTLYLAFVVLIGDYPEPSAVN